MLERLHRGDTETVNLMEQIAMSFTTLAQIVFPSVPLTPALADRRLVHRMRAGGVLVLGVYGHEAACALTNHLSDTVRAWAAMAIGAEEKLGMGERLELIRPFADDSHFAVREWAWISLRPWITADLQKL